MTGDIRTIKERLRKGKAVLGDPKKNHPLLAYAYSRWHLLTYGFVQDNSEEEYKGIAAVNFMNEYRADEYIGENSPYCPIVDYPAVSPDFEKEIETKILPGAEAYRQLLLRKDAIIAGGFTTDTLRRIQGPKQDIEGSIAILETMIRRGEMGPFIMFKKSASAILGET